MNLWRDELMRSVGLCVLAPATPLRRQLAEYAGEYYSPELDAVYRLDLKEGALCARIMNEEPDGTSPFSFQPMLRDEFVSIPDRVVVRFGRNDDGAVGGFLLSKQFGWVIDIEFARIEN